MIEINMGEELLNPPLTRREAAMSIPKILTNWGNWLVPLIIGIVCGLLSATWSLSAIYARINVQANELAEVKINGSSAFQKYVIEDHAKVERLSRVEATQQIELSRLSILENIHSGDAVTITELKASVDKLSDKIDRLANLAAEKHSFAAPPDNQHARGPSSPDVAN